MAVAGRPGDGYMERPRPSGLADVIDIVLDKGLVVDAYVRVSLVGIELLTIDARIVIASVDTYLRFAEAVAAADSSFCGPTSGGETIARQAAVGRRLARNAPYKAATKGAIDGVKERSVIGRGEMSAVRRRSS